MPDNRPSDSDLTWLPWYEQLKMRRRLQSRHSEPDPARRASTLKSLLEFAPVTGEASAARDALSANERAATNLQEGDFWGALSNYGDMALAGLGAIPLMGMAGRATRKGVRAYHGSPHDFEQFQMDKIGTGEGHQAYGHGMYFAEEPSVARKYRDQETQRYGRLLTGMRDYGIPQEEADVIALSYLERFKHDPEHVKALINESPTGQIIKDVVEGRVQKNPGRMYEVDIAADPEDFLDWDRPLSEQSEAVRKRVDDLRRQDPQVDHMLSLAERGMRQHGREPTIGQVVSATDNPQVFTQAGIPGVKYLDEGSRTAGEGTRNYVVFDDKLINIVKKYGIAGALGAGIITADQAQALQAEGHE